jgi:hypothetical protein
MKKLKTFSDEEMLKLFNPDGKLDSSKIEIEDQIFGKNASPDGCLDFHYGNLVVAYTRNNTSDHDNILVVDFGHGGSTIVIDIYESDFNLEDFCLKSHDQAAKMSQIGKDFIEKITTELEKAKQALAPA